MALLASTPALAEVAAPAALLEQDGTADAPILAISYDLATISVQPSGLAGEGPVSELLAPIDPTDVLQSSGPQGAEAPSVSATSLEPPQAYGFKRFGRQVKAVPLEVGGLLAGITALGVTNWNWGNSSFRFNNEGWFGRNSSSLGMDKLGHAYTTYAMTEFVTAAINRESSDSRGSELTAGLVAMGLMTYVEVFDGFSGDHGFSREDLISDALGAGFSILRSRVPVLKRTIDFRLDYRPSDNVSGFHPITDYSGQRYVIAFQPAGIKGLERSPLAYVEFLGGYYARGFTAEETARGEGRRRELFVGIGLNLQHLLFRNPKRRWQRMASSALDYVQVPYTQVYSN